jgi:HAMP domain-containing protein
VLKDQFAQVKKAFTSSLLAKAFATSFVSVHIPIIFLLAYVAAGAELSSKLVLLIALLATILGTAIAFLTMHKLLSPLSALTNSLRDYRISGAAPKFGAERMDDIGRLTTEFQDLVGALEQKISLLKRQAYSDPLTALGNRRWLAKRQVLKSHARGGPGCPYPSSRSTWITSSGSMTISGTMSAISC